MRGRRALRRGADAAGRGGEEGGGEARRDWGADAGTSLFSPGRRRGEERRGRWLSLP